MKHLNYYIIETFILGFGFFVLYAFSFPLKYQAFFVLGLVIIYSSMGIIHHRLMHDIHPRIVLEYILISLLVLAIFIFFKSGTI